MKEALGRMRFALQVGTVGPVLCFIHVTSLTDNFLYRHVRQCGPQLFPLHRQDFQVLQFRQPAQYFLQSRPQLGQPAPHQRKLSLKQLKTRLNKLMSEKQYAELSLRCRWFEYRVCRQAVAKEGYYMFKPQ